MAHPAHATAVRVRLATTIAGSAGDSFDVDRTLFLFDAPSGNIVSIHRSTVSITFDAGGHTTIRHEVDLELPLSYPTGAPQTLEFNVTYTNVGTFSAQTASIVGWRAFI